MKSLNILLIIIAVSQLSYSQTEEISAGNTKSEIKEVGCLFWMNEAIAKRNTYRYYDFLQNKIYKNQNTYTMLGIIDDNQVEYMSEKSKAGEIIKDRFPLPLSVREVTGGKIGYSLIKNKILSSFFSWYNRLSPQIVAVDLPTAKKFSYLDYKPTAPYAASLSRLNSSPISRYFQRAIGRQNTLQVDYGTDEKEFIYLVVKFDADMSVWRYEEDFLVFDNPEMPLHESGMKRAEKIFHNKEVSFNEFTSFVLNNKLFIATDENKIYKYSKGNLTEIRILPTPYNESLFIIDKDEDKLFYITRKELLYSATIAELEMKEIKLGR